MQLHLFAISISAAYKLSYNLPIISSWHLYIILLDLLWVYVNQKSTTDKEAYLTSALCGNSYQKCLCNYYC